MAKFRDVKSLQKFVSAHASIHNHFNLDRHLNRRGIFKVDYQVTRHVDAYAVIMSETSGYVAQAGRLRRGGVALIGFQWIR